MKKKLLNIIYTFVLMLACSFTACDKPEAEKNLPPAIQALIDKNSNCTCGPFIDQYQWRGQDVYLFSCAGPACNCIVLYYDKNANPINIASGYTPDDFRNEARFIKNAWKCSQP